MKLITSDHILQKIPPFLESDVHDKIIISITSDLITKNISYASQRNDDIITF